VRKAKACWNGEKTPQELRDFKGGRGMKGRAGLMRIDGTVQTRGVLTGCSADASSATLRDVLWNHYGGCRVQAIGRYAVALRQWQQRGLRS
jgi:hypothetical protein